MYSNKIYLNGVLESQFVYYNNGVAINDVKSNVPLLNLSDSQYVNFDITNKTVTIPQSSILFNTNGRSLPSQTINLTQTTTENNSWALLYDYNNNAIIASFWKGTFNYPLIGAIYANKLYINGVLESQIRTYDDGELIPAHPIPSTPIINLTENQFIKYNFTDKTVDIPQCSILCGAVGKAFPARTIDLSQTETQNNCWALLYDYNNNDIIASFWKGTFDYPVIGVVYGKKIFINGALDSQLISVGQESIVHFFGDSITAGVHTTKAYHMYWAEWGNFKCKNYGIGTTGYKRTYSGSALAGNGVEGIGSITTQTGDNTLLDVMQTVGSFSKCVLFAGTNDFGNSETATSFRTAVQNTLDYALSKTPFILVITPIMRTDYKTHVNNVGMKLSDYSDIIKEECDNRGIACIDGMSVMLNPDNALYKSNFIPDGLHPNSTGHNMLARKLYNDFLSAMCK